MDTPALRWSAYEHDHIERESDWYWALGVAAISIAIIAIILHNVLFGVLVILAAVTLGLLARTPPELAHFEISERGIRVNEHLHRWDHIISFWVEDEHGDRPLLLVDTTKIMSPNLIIPIEHIDPSLVRSFLKDYAKEVHMKEPLAHKILEFLGL
ncbi:hypothetical protein C4568_04520 [Candidatus Parcubacteria bacterium]|nr:MAG: hypothetical protein C4568_04520 [Candidatus Parcubacteria bacterium]